MMAEDEPTETEIQWALDIKKAALADRSIDEHAVSDWEQHNLSALRSGLVFFVDCQDMLLGCNYSRKTEIHARQLFIHGYPSRIHQCAMCHATYLCPYAGPVSARQTLFEFQIGTIVAHGT